MHRNIVLASWLLVISISSNGQMPRASPFDGNPIFQKSVRISAEGIPVSDLLQRVSKAAGVTLKASPETGDDKIVLFGPCRPLAGVLGDVAALFGDEWIHSQMGGRDVYILEKKQSTREREQALATSVRRQLTTQMEIQVRALRETPPQLASRPETDPIRLVLQNLDARRATTYYSRLNSAQRDRLFDRGHLRILFTDLPRDIQPVIYNLAPPAAEPYRRERIGSLIGSVKQRTTPSDMEFEASINVNQRTVMRFWPGSTPFAYLYATEPQIRPHCDPYSESLVSESSVPDLPKLNLKKADSDWIGRLRSLSKATGLPVLADYYRVSCMDQIREQPVKGDDKFAKLDAFSKEGVSLWWTSDKSLLFRKTDWYQRRLYEVPDRWLVETFRNLASHRERPSYADLQRIGELSFRQQAGLAGLGYRWSGDVVYVLSRTVEKLAGLTEFLGVIKYGNRSNNLLVQVDESTVEASNRSLELSRIKFADLGLSQRLRIPEFLTAVSTQPQGEPVEGFYAYIRFSQPDETERGFRVIPIQLNWRIGPGGTSGTFEIRLPISLPDDRADRTIVELIP